jgi:hypothetical protein
MFAVATNKKFERFVRLRNWKPPNGMNGEVEAPQRPPRC